MAKSCVSVQTITGVRRLFVFFRDERVLLSGNLHLSIVIVVGNSINVIEVLTMLAANTNFRWFSGR